MKKIEQLDVFTLIGLSDLSDQSKNERLRKMEEIILTDFLRNDLDKYLSAKQIEELTKEISKGLSGEKILQKISEYLPRFNEILYDKTQDFKKTLAKNQLHLKLEINNKRRELLERNLYPKQNPSLEEKVSTLQALEKEKTILTQVLNFYEKEDWEPGINLWEKLKLS